MDHKLTLNPGDTVSITVAQATQSTPPAPTPAPVPGLALPLPAGLRCRPFTPDSPWNSIIPPSPVLDPRSVDYATGIGPLSSNAASYTLPVYAAPAGTPFTTFTATGIATIVAADGKTKTSAAGKQIKVPMPAGAAAAAGSDGQIVVVDLTTGDEYDLWQVSGTTVKNMTLFRGGVLSPGTTGVQYPSRGAGVPYLAGLIRPWEIQQGYIDHALAFAYDKVSSEHRYPATKSDGTGGGLPEGARLQLDPGFDVNTLADPVARIVARALQIYGAYVIDYAGNPGKIYAEYQGTAKWGSAGIPAWTSSTVSKIPANRLRVLRQWDGK